MGRRLVFLLGMALLVAWGPARVLGAQADPLADPAEAQEPSPLTAFDAAPAPEESAPADLPPARDPLPGMDDAAAPTPPKPRRPQAAPAAAPQDEAVERVQAPAPAPAAAPATPPPADADGGFLTSPERLPLGRHEVVVNVEVQAPAEMNLHKPATAVIIVANTGSSDAFDVTVRDELPPGLTFVSSTVPPETGTTEQGLLIWRLGTLAAGASKKIPIQVTPTQVVHMDHAATVTFRAGSKARSLVREPKLKVEVVQAPSVAKQLKGKTVDYKISVTNTGDGPARNILVQAKLSPGLRHESVARSDDNSLEHPIDALGPGERYDLPTLTVDATQGGRQTCTVKATSNDVVLKEKDADAEVERFIEVVEPKMKIDLVAPDKQYTDTVAKYEVTVENPGTAPAKNVQVSVALPVSGKLVDTPPDAVYDRKAQRLRWTIAELPPTDPANPASKPRVLPFQIRLGDVGFYEVTAEAKAEGVAVERQKRSTDVQGMADLDLIVYERKRVVEAGGETMFLIKLQNYGKKEASGVQVDAVVSDNLQPTETSGGPEGTSNILKEDKKLRVRFPKIDRIGPGATMILGVKVKAVNAGDGIGICEVDVKHEDEAALLRGMANVKVMQGRRTAGAAAEPGVK